MNPFIININIYNHIPYLILCIHRTLFFRNIGYGERPFYYEKSLLKLLLRPIWNKKDHESLVNTITNVNNKILAPRTFYLYQLLEGIFHFSIVYGGLTYSMNKQIFDFGIISEALIMDIPYTLAFTYIGLLTNTRYAWSCVFIHHLTVLPNFLYLFEIM